MSENRNITWKVTFAIDANVTSPAKLILQSSRLDRGQWKDKPSNEISTSPGTSVVHSFMAMGDKCSATGTEGKVEYKATDAEGTIIQFKFVIPYSNANSGGVTCGSANFRIDGGIIPVSGNSVTVPVTITQIR
jgi:hypothetical protein